MQNICRLYGAVGKVGKGDECKVYAKYMINISDYIKNSLLFL